MTVTLPERTLERLAAIDVDRASAIVKIVDSTSPANGQGKLVEIVKVGATAGVILVAASQSLRRIPWLKLAEVRPGRYLLTVVPGTTIESLEVMLLDILESLPRNDEYERAILEELRRVISSNRRSQQLEKFEMLYVRP